MSENREALLSFLGTAPTFGPGICLAPVHDYVVSSPLEAEHTALVASDGMSVQAYCDPKSIISDTGQEFC